MTLSSSSECVYILRCSDGSLYCGWTNQLEKRLDAHNRGVGAKYTKTRLPVSLAWWAKCSDRSEAMRVEVMIKRLSRPAKLLLIKEPSGLSPSQTPLLKKLLQQASEAPAPRSG